MMYFPVKDSCLYNKYSYFCYLEPTKGDKVKLPYPVIIGVSCGGIFVLAILSILLIRYCHRRKIVSNRRVSDGMPANGAFPKPEKYELKETEAKKDVVRYEEIAMWKDPVRYEELGVFRDAADYEKLDFSNGTTYQEIGIPNVADENQEIGISKDALR